tara:strand:- start:541 stop:972 length:432 start_codon:yes stop_codon:yes gene_type:complete
MYARKLGENREIARTRVVGVKPVIWCPFCDLSVQIDDPNKPTICPCGAIVTEGVPDLGPLALAHEYGARLFNSKNWSQASLVLKEIVSYNVATENEALNVAAVLEEESVTEEETGGDMEPPAEQTQEQSPARFLARPRKRTKA